MSSVSPEVIKKCIERVAKGRRYIESFYAVLSPAVARAIKKEIKGIV
jgi:hypothetical protein